MRPDLAPPRRRAPAVTFRPGPLPRHPRRGGFVVVMHVSLLLALAAVVSVAVDYGRVQMVKMQLRTAADAAALYAAAALPDASAASARAADVAGQNGADGSPIALDPSDVEVGNWDTAARTFAAAAKPYNAVRVTAVRCAARGTGVPLTFGKLIGATTCDARASSIACLAGVPSSYGIVGINWFRSQGLMTADSYPSGDRGDVASNGDVTLNLLGLVGVTDVNGSVRPGIGKAVKKPAIAALTWITGSTAPLTDALVYPPVVVGASAAYNDNGQLPASIFDGTDLTAALSTTLPGGTYVVRNLTLLANVTLNFSGPVTIYVTGSANVVGSLLVSSHDAADLRMYVAGAGPVNLAANVRTYMDLYAPQADVTFVAGLGYYGRVIGGTLDVVGTSFIHYDESLSPPAVPHGVKLVR